MSGEGDGEGPGGAPQSSGFVHGASFDFTAHLRAKSAVQAEEGKSALRRAVEAGEDLFGSDSEGSDAVPPSREAPGDQECAPEDGRDADSLRRDERGKRRREESRQGDRRRGSKRRDRRSVSPRERTARDRGKRGGDQVRDPASALPEDLRRMLAASRAAESRGPGMRVGTVTGWAGDEWGPAETWFEDRHADRDITFYLSLYRGDVPAYRRMDPGGVARASPGGEAAGGRGRADEDRTSLRYFAPGILRREADNASYRVPLWRRGGGGRGQGGRDVPWADVLPTDASIFVGRGGAVGLRGGAAAAEGASQSIAEDWVPLVPGAMPRGRRAGLGASRIGDGGGGEGDGETVVGALMRETRELNAEVAAHSGDVHAWLRLVRFQERAAAALHPRGGAALRRAVAEKQLAILRKALEANGDSEALALAVMRAAAEVSTPASLERRWGSVLADMPQSLALWREYLAFKRGRFGDFDIHALRDVYRSALATLDARRGSLLRSLGLDSRVHVTAGLGPAMEGGEVARMRAACEGTERVIAEVVAGAVALEMEAGHLERATVAVQCVLEYTLRPPPLPPLTSESQKRSHFRSLFDSGEPLFGEEKAPGWARWALGGRAEGGSNQGGAGEGETPEPAPETAEDRGGWTGWRDLSEFGGVKEFESMGVNFALLRREEEGGGAGEGGDGGDEKEEGRDGDEEILAMIREMAEEDIRARVTREVEGGLGGAGGAMTAAAMRRWLRMERERTRERWRAPRPTPTPADSDPPGPVPFEDISPLLYSFACPAVCRQLALALLALLGAPTLDPTHALPLLHPLRRPSVTVVSNAAAIARSVDVPWHRSAPGRAAFLASAAKEVAGSGAGEGAAAVGGAVALLHAGHGADDDGVEEAGALGPAGVGGAAPPVWMACGSCGAGLGEPGSVRGNAGVAAQLSGGGAAAVAAFLSTRGADPVPFVALAEWEAAMGRDKAARKAFKATLAGAAQIPLLTRPVGAPASAPPALDSRPADVVLNYAWGELHAALAALAEGTADAADRAATRVRAARDALARLGMSAAAHAPTMATATQHSATPDPDAWPSARRGFQAVVPCAVASLTTAGFDPATCCWPMCAALGDALHGHLHPARALLHNVLGSLRDPGRTAASLTGDLPLSLALASPGALPSFAPLRVDDGSASAPHAAARLMSAWWCEALCFLESAGRGGVAATLGLPAVSLGQARGAVVAALGLDPSNPRLLQLLCGIEAAGMTHSRLRRGVGLVLARVRERQWVEAGRGWAEGPLLRAAVRAEARVPGSHHRVRGLFEEALSSPACAQDWRWWADYLAFEAGRGQADMARRVFLRGVSACPWSKPLWMNGLSLLLHPPGGGDPWIAPSEAGSLVDMMAERGVEVHVDVYEAILAEMDSEGAV